MFSGQGNRPKGAKQVPSLKAGAERRQRQVMSVRCRAHGELMKHVREEADVSPPEEPQEATMDVWAYNEWTSPSAVPIALLPHFVQMIVECGNDADLMQGTLMIRKLLSVDRNPLHEEVAASGVVPYLVRLLDRFDLPKLQFEAAWALTNVAAGTSHQARLLVDCDAIPHFVALLGSADSDCRDQAAWAIGNLAGDGTHIRDVALATNAIPALLHILSFLDQPINVLRNATWALSNLCRGKPAPPLEHVAIALPLLAGLLSHTDVELVADALWAISYISDGPSERVQAVLNSGIVPLTVELLTSTVVPVQTAAVRIIGNIAGGEDMQTQTIIDAGALLIMSQLLAHSKREIRKETCWTISNIAAGSREQVDALVRANLFPALIQHCLSGTDLDVRKEAVWTIANVTHCGSAEHMRYLLSCGVIPPLCEALLTQRSKVILVAFEALDGFLQLGADDYFCGATTQNEVAQAVQDCGGLDTLERLQASDNHEVYASALKLVEFYFTTDDSMPDMPQENFEFDANIGGGQPTDGQFNF